MGVRQFNKIIEEFISSTALVYFLMIITCCALVGHIDRKFATQVYRILGKVMCPFVRSLYVHPCCIYD